MSDSINKLVEIMATLRDPERGCPWDCAQTYASIIPHTIEETYEVADCIEREDYAHLKEELGDLLFQVVFLARIAQEQGLFDFDDVADAISEKLTRRHPHVFGNMKIESEAELKAVWESIKQQEREAKRPTEKKGALLNVEATHPAITHAYKLQQAAAKVGFDWPSTGPVFDKVQEELSELQQALEHPQDSAAIEHEMGDILFAVVNLSRHVGVKPETALRKVNYRFQARFQLMETLITSNNQNIDELTLEQLEAYWQQAKQKLGNG